MKVSTKAQFPIDFYPKSKFSANQLGQNLKIVENRKEVSKAENKNVPAESLKGIPCKTSFKLKANRPHLRNDPHTPIDYRHTPKTGNGSYTKYQGHRFSRESGDRRTDRRTLPSILSPSIKSVVYGWVGKDVGRATQMKVDMITFYCRPH